MLNVIFLVLLFFVYAIQFASIYKFFRHKDWLKAIGLSIFGIIVLILTISYFFTRHALLYNEIEWVIEGVKNQNLYAIAIVILNIVLLITSLYSYVTVVKYKKN